MCACEIGDNVNEHKEALRRSVMIRNPLDRSHIITAEKPKNKESSSPKAAAFLPHQEFILPASG